MNKIIPILVFLASFLAGYFFTSQVFGEVNISEVEGKYQEPTLEDIIEYNKAEASKVALLGLQMAYRAGYAQATLDCEVHHSTDTK